MPTRDESKNLTLRQTTTNPEFKETCKLDENRKTRVSAGGLGLSGKETLFLSVVAIGKNKILLVVKICIYKFSNG